jgi:hypothetical protein
MVADRRISLEPHHDEPLVLRKGLALSEPHRRLIRLLAEQSVQEFLKEQAVDGNADVKEEPDDDANT